MRNSSLQERYFLYRFKLLISTVGVSGAEDGRVQLVWRSERGEKFYNDPSFVMRNGELKVNAVIELEELLVKQQPSSSFLSVASEIVVQRLLLNGSQGIASLRIDLHDLAMSDNFNEIKQINMFSPSSERAWIGMALNGTSYMEVTREEAEAFGYSGDSRLMEDAEERRENRVEEGNGWEKQEIRRMKREEKVRLKNRHNFETMVKLLDGKDEIIAELEEKSVLLIDVVRTMKEDLVQMENQMESQKALIEESIHMRINVLSPQITEKSQKSKFALPTPRASRVLGMSRNASFMKEPEMEMSRMLRRETSRIFIQEPPNNLEQELREIITHLEEENEGLKDRVSMMEGGLMELKEAKEELYESKKKGILLGEQNEALKSAMSEVKDELHRQSQIKAMEFPEVRMKTEAEEGRLLTCASQPDRDEEQWRLDVELMKTRERALLDQIQRLRGRVREFQRLNLDLKRTHSFIDREPKSDSVNQLMKNKVAEYSSKIVESEHEHKTLIYKLQSELHSLNFERKSLESDKEALEGKYDHLKEIYDKIKENNTHNEKKLLLTHRLEVKNKQLEQFVKRLQQTIQKQDTELRDKQKQLLEVSYNRQLSKTRDGEFRNPSGNNSLENSLYPSADRTERKRRNEASQIRKSECRLSIRQIQSTLKAHKLQLEEAISNKEEEEAEKAQENVKELESRLKAQLNELNALDVQDPMSRAESMSRGVQTQQIIQENQELRAYIRELSKKIIEFEIVTPDSIEGLINERDIIIKHYTFKDSIEDLSSSLDEEEITKEQLAESISKFKQLCRNTIEQMKKDTDRIIQKEKLADDREISSKKRESKLNIIEYCVDNKKLSGLINEPKWKESDMMEYTDMKRKEKEMKIKINGLESKALADKMEFDADKQELVKKYKEDQKKLMTDTKENNEKQINAWKGEISDLEKKVKEKDTEAKGLLDELIQMKTALENQQRLAFMKASQYNLKMDESNSTIKELSQQYRNEVGKNKYSLESIKQLNRTVNELTETLENKHTEMEQMEEEFRDFKEEMEEVVEELNRRYEELERMAQREKELLVSEMERLKLLVEDEVIKSVKFEDEYKVLCETINSSEGEIKELNIHLQRKDDVIDEMERRFDLKMTEFKVVEEEYNRMLVSIEEESNKYASLKGEYTSLQMMQERTEEFIQELESGRELDRSNFELVLDEHNKDKRAFILEINQMLKTAGDKEIEYRRSVHEFELHSMKMEEDLQLQKFNIRKVMQDLDTIIKERDDLKQERMNLMEELESKVDRKDKKDKKRRLGTNVDYLAEKSSMQVMSKLEIQKDPSCTGSALEGHKSQSVELDLPKNPITDDPFAPYTPHTPQSHPDPPNIDETIQHQLIFTQSSRRNNHRFSAQDPPFLRVTDQNGDEIGRSPVIRSHSLTRAVTSGLKNQPLELVYEQSLDRASKSISKSSKQNESDSEEELHDEIRHLKEKVDELSKELLEKQILVNELEAINKKNQVEMMETKKYLEASFKRKTKRNSHGSPSVESPRQRESPDNISESIRQMDLYIGQEIEMLEEELGKEKAISGKYADEIKELGEEFVAQEQEHQRLERNIEEFEDELREARSKEEELFQNIEGLMEELKSKERLLSEFEEVVRLKDEERIHSEQMVESLQQELQTSESFRNNLETGLDEMHHELSNKEHFLDDLTRSRNEAQSKLETANDLLEKTNLELADRSVAFKEKEGEVTQLKERVEELEMDLESMAERYLALEENIHQGKVDLEGFEKRFTDKSEKHDDTLKKFFSIEREKGLLELKISEIEASLVMKEKVIHQGDEEVRRLLSQIIHQKRLHEIQQAEFQSALEHLSAELQSKDQNMDFFKNDIEVFHAENKKLKDLQSHSAKENQEVEEQIKLMVRTFEAELNAEKVRCSELKQEILVLQEIIDEQRRELNEISQMERQRESLVEQVERNNRETIVKLETELRVINEEIQKRIQLSASEIAIQYEDNLSLKEREYQTLKMAHDREIKAIEAERLEMFSQKCQLEETRVEMSEQQMSFKAKIQRYEGEISQICDKLRNMEGERPHIELFEEVTFQNEIFKNRITQLEEVVAFKERVNNEYYIEELQNLKVRYSKDRQDYLQDLEGYSAQVADLEERNYQLMTEIQEIKEYDYHDLKEENLELERSVTRLETCEEELRRELQLLKGKREEEYRQYLTDLRSLRVK